MIYDPKEEMNTPPLWERENTSKNETGNVPKGCKVRVIGAFVTFT